MKVDLEQYKKQMAELTSETIRFEYERLKDKTDDVSKSKKYRLLSILRERNEI